MGEIRSFQGNDVRPARRPAVMATLNESGRRRQGPEPPAPDNRTLIPEVIGIAARVAVWCCIFCLLLIGLVTYPAPVLGTFVLLVLLARLARRTHL